MGKKNGPLTKGLSSWIDEVKTLSLLLLNEPAPRNEFMVSTHATTNDTKCLEIQKKNISSFLYPLPPISTINKDVTPSKTERYRTRLPPTVSAGLLGDLDLTATALSAPQKSSGSFIICGSSH